MIDTEQELRTKAKEALSAMKLIEKDIEFKIHQRIDSRTIVCCKNKNKNKIELYKDHILKRL